MFSTVQLRFYEINEFIDFVTIARLEQTLERLVDINRSFRVIKLVLKSD